MIRRIVRPLAVSICWVCVGFAAAQAPDSSLNKVPADAYFYSASLRLGEQWDMVQNSKAYAKIMALPAVKTALQRLHEEAHKPNNPWGHLIALAHAKENQELMGVVHDLMRHEVFYYGGEDSIKMFSLIGSVAFGSRIDQMVNRLQGDNSPEAQLKGALDGLKDSLDDIVAPDLVMGFRVGKPDPVKNLLPQWETMLNKAMERAPKELQGKLRREKIGDADALVFQLDGSMLPWAKMKIEDLEDEKDEYKPVIDKLKALKLTVALAVKGNYVLLSLGSSTAAVGKFGQGPALATLPELAPLSKFADRKIVGIDYTSKKMAESMATTAKDLAEMVKSAKEGLKETPLSDDLRDKIVKDIEAWTKEAEKSLPKPYAEMAFSFLNGTGVEGYAYQFGNASALKPLTITDNVGGAPLIAVAGRGEDATPAYLSLVKWLKIFWAHAEAATAELAGEAMADQMKAGLQQILPFLQRFDELTGGQLLPALADGQGGMVVDGRWTSKKWFPEVDQAGHELPMLEFGLIFGVSNSEKLLEAFKGYRKLVNDLLDVARGFGAEIPEGGWPAPKTEAIGAATAFYWPLPPMGQEESIQPNIAVSKSLLTIATSMKFAGRLQANQPNAFDWKALANGNPIQAATWVDSAGLLKVVRPWVEKLGVPAMQAEAKDDAPEGMRKADIPNLVATVLDVLACIKSGASVTYREGGNTITHMRSVIEDIK